MTDPVDTLMDGGQMICTYPPRVGDEFGADCPHCGHNNLLHSRSQQPCVACVLLARTGRGGSDAN